MQGSPGPASPESRGSRLLAETCAGAATFLPKGGNSLVTEGKEGSRHRSRDRACPGTSSSEGPHFPGSPGIRGATRAQTGETGPQTTWPFLASPSLLLLPLISPVCLETVVRERTRASHSLLGCLCWKRNIGPEPWGLRSQVCVVRGRGGNQAERCVRVSLCAVLCFAHFLASLCLSFPLVKSHSAGPGTRDTCDLGSRGL